MQFDTFASLFCVDVFPPWKECRHQVHQPRSLPHRVHRSPFSHRSIEIPPDIQTDNFFLPPFPPPPPRSISPLDTAETKRDKERWRKRRRNETAVHFYPLNRWNWNRNRRTKESKRWFIDSRNSELFLFLSRSEKIVPRGNSGWKGFFPEEE